MKLLFQLAALALSAGALAQDLKKIQPVPAPPMTPPPAAVADDTADAEAFGELLPGLRGIVFIARPEQVSEPANLIDGVDTSRVPFLADEQFRQRVATHVGQPLRLQRLKRLLASVHLFYAAHDRPFVSVSTPEQDITEGILRVLVVEGRVESVRVEGNHYFPESQYLNALKLSPGDPLYKSQLDSALGWINRNPFRSATVIAAPGESFGGTSLILRTRERFPLRTYLSTDNTGTRQTDEKRLAVGVNWGNAFGLGHQLDYQLTVSPDFDRSRGHSARYVVPLPWRHLFTVSGAWSRIDALMPVDFDAVGESWQVQLRYEAPLRPTGPLSQAVIAGVDFKRSDNNLEFGGIPVTDNSTDVVQAVLAYRVGRDDRFGRTAAVVSATYSPGGITDRNETRYFDISRWGAKADYAYARLDFDRQTILPAGLTWRLSASAQIASGNLLGSEQLGYAGTYGVRGYRENEGYGDEGYLIRNELRLPPFSPLARGDRLQPVAFHDYGVGSVEEPLPGERERTTLSSAGIGARYSFGSAGELRFEYAWQLRKLPWEASRGERAHFGILLSY